MLASFPVRIVAEATIAVCSGTAAGTAAPWTAAAAAVETTMLSKGVRGMDEARNTGVASLTLSHNSCDVNVVTALICRNAFGSE